MTVDAVRNRSSKVRARSGTVVVGAFCPWVPGVSFDFPIEIAIIADCRMSYVDEKFQPVPDLLPSDDTLKVFPLGPYAIGGYSGAPGSATTALGFLSEKLFRLQPLPRWGNDCFERIRRLPVEGARYAKQRAMSQSELNACGTFELLIAFFDNEVRPHLLHFESKSSRLHISHPGPVLIGSGSQYREAFNRNLHETMLEAGTGSYEMSTFASWLSWSVVKTYLKDQPDIFVGGGVQQLNVSMAHGVRQHGLMTYGPKDGQEVSPDGPFDPDRMEWSSYTPANLRPYPEPRRRGDPRR